MNFLRIGIVEDDPLAANSLKMHLEKMGHQIAGNFSDYQGVFCYEDVYQPDLYLIDIHLRGEQTGIDIAKRLQKEGGPPYIFITSNTEYPTLRGAMGTDPIGYISKPFSFNDLLINIELARAKLDLNYRKVRKIELKKSVGREWLPVNQIHFLEADRSYVRIHLSAGQRVIRKSLKDFLQQFRFHELIRIHRSFAVNPHKVEAIFNNKVCLDGKDLPLAPLYRQAILEVLRKINAFPPKGSNSFESEA